MSLTIGGTVQIIAVVSDGSGQVIVGAVPDAWYTTNAAVATVDGSGLVRGVGVGTALISASITNLAGIVFSNALPVIVSTVIDDTPVAVVISPTTLTLVNGASQPINASINNAAGTSLALSPTSWTSSDPTKATVDASGMVTWVAAGSTNITAHYNALTSNTCVVTTSVDVNTIPDSVLVSPSTLNLQFGAPQQLSAVVKNAAGTALAFSPTSWTSSDPTKATVSATGVVTWVAQGSTNVVAHYNAIASNTCVVTAVPHVADTTPASIVVAPSTMTLVHGSPQQLAAVIKNAAGTALALSPTSWTSSDPTKATVNSSGVVTWVAAGSTNITAHYNAITSNTCVVTAAVDLTVATSLLIFPSTLNLQSGAPQTIAATVQNAIGSALPLTPTSWTSSDPGKATVNSSGVVTWVAAGTTNIVAHYNAIDSNTCVVTALTNADNTPTAVTISPTTLTVASGAPQTINATITNVSGVALALTPTSWTSSNPAAATVNSSGVVTWVASGSTNIVAHYNALDSNTCVVTASADTTPASVTVSPTTLTLQSGAPQTLSAVIANAGGSALGLSPTSWTSSNPAAATVNSSGVVTWVAAGSTNVAAHYNALTSNNCAVTAVAVVDTTPASVTISPTTITLTPGASQALSAVIKNAGGSALALSPTSWTSSDATKASVTPTGVVTWIAQGSTNVVAHYNAINSNTCVVTTLSGGGGNDTHPNEPAGFFPLSRLLTGDVHPPTTAEFIPGSANDIDWFRQNTADVVTDPAVPVDSTNVLETRYPAGMQGGGSPGSVFTPLTFWGGTVRRLYASLWYKVSPNFPLNLVANKVWYCLIQNAISGGNAACELVGMLGGSADIKTTGVGTVLYGGNVADAYTAALVPYIATQGNSGIGADGISGTGTPLLPAVAPSDFGPYQMYRGQWHHLEYYYELNTPGNFDGTIKHWVDGRLQVDYTHRFKMVQDGTSPGRFIVGSWTPVYGGGGMVPNDAVNAYHHIKNFYISGSEA